MSHIRPPSLNPKDHIAVIAPSYWCDEDVLISGESVLKQSGYHVDIHPQTAQRFHACAGTHAQKIDALHEVWETDDIKAVIAARGGCRSAHLLDRINWSNIRTHQKILMGFSDMTALLNAFYAKTRLVTFHGPTAVSFASGLDEAWQRLAFRILNGQCASYPMKDAVTLNTGTGKGTLIGGNLSAFVQLIGTQYMPQCDNALLFFEDDGLEIRQLDRIFWQIKHSGIMDNATGLIFGGLNNITDTGDSRFGLNVDDLIQEHFGSLDIPVILNAPFGHGKDMATFPIGGEAKLTASPDNTIELGLTKPAVRLD